jgi:hypothetical protein
MPRKLRGKIRRVASRARVHRASRFIAPSVTVARRIPFRLGRLADAAVQAGRLGVISSISQSRCGAAWSMRSNLSASFRNESDTLSARQLRPTIEQTQRGATDHLGMRSLSGDPREYRTARLHVVVSSSAYGASPLDLLPRDGRPSNGRRGASFERDR